MTARVASLWRHPIKGVGREEVTETFLEPGSTMPGDRLWAIAHEAAEDAALSGNWAMCRNYLRGASSPSLMAVTAELQDDGQLSLSHPDAGSITLDPARNAETLLEWVAPLVADGRPAPKAVVRASERGFTDNPDFAVTICNAASHRAVEQRVGRTLSPHRWRGNIWLDGLAPWEEFDLVGREIRIGEARFEIGERTGRCRATEANPDTGRRDADTLGALRSWGHMDFSVQASCTLPGRIATGDTMVIL
ncbi:hypothetical protein SAMN05421853_101104 [Roseivivax halotolerans]|uniref:MOSC domain-containing protein n=1 Tax=Roseivivax halotolerans TaxID=93684 RepID=A0A1I5URA1_9RHOB|nr:MOSC N-terminal beta barrel domain-containing protein [Roseivivax halotolerans]SFP97246.1 hypothetical protein SAMN05421853_101104 [Roseivivax halotolerans]